MKVSMNSAIETPAAVPELAGVAKMSCVAGWPAGAVLAKSELLMGYHGTIWASMGTARKLLELFGNLPFLAKS
jgi:hypothetical protein